MSLTIRRPAPKSQNPARPARRSPRATPKRASADPRKERQSMLRFLAYLKPHLPLFVFATLCGVETMPLVH